LGVYLVLLAERNNQKIFMVYKPDKLFNKRRSRAGVFQLDYNEGVHDGGK